MREGMPRGGEQGVGYLAELRGLKLTDAESAALARYWEALRGLRPRRGVEPPITPMAPTFDPIEGREHG